MAIIDVVLWQPGSAGVYAWKYPEENLSTYTQLIVAESQEAVLFSRGQMLGKFGPGKHTLSTENLPLLRTLYGIPFGGKNPFTAQVWFVNKLQPLNIEWETDSFRYNDPDYKTMVPLKAQGRYGLKVTDAERFLKRLVGTATEFTSRGLTDNFLGNLISKAKSSISRTMQSKQIGIKSISAYLEQIGVALREDMIPFWTDYGFDLIGFFITSIDIDDKTPDGQEILRAMAQQSAQSIAGYTWQQGESFRVAEKALSSQGDIGVWGAAMMAGGNLFGGNSGTGNIFQPVPTSVGNQVTASGQVTESNVRQIFCSKCAKKYPSTSKYCPHCGNEAHLCLKCGSDNDAHAANCVACGASLQSAAETITCPKCSTAASKDATFCPQCGTALAKMCPRCKSKLPDKAPFCPTCGLKTE